MLMDSRLQLATGASPRADGLFGDIIDTTTARDLFAGAEKVHFVVRVSTAGTGGTSAIFYIAASNTQASNALTSSTVLARMESVALAALTANATFDLVMPQRSIAGVNGRYLQAGVDVAGTFTALSVDAWLGLGQPKTIAYPDAVN